ncbi:uncharacterized protein LOC107371541 [Tetranychus urticae]|uniref:Major facilitator superfamily (MFS) profile domain-containing protein n=1 Tax=Tetranychus urticae TaxID=32264 RepID=T1JX23_TETUR|nr:uncharacterized protein LOC107371541 [Tetranychus urticae]
MNKPASPNMSKIRKLLAALCHLKVDVYYLLCMLPFALPMVTFTQFAQDKYCLNEHKLGWEICKDLAELSDPDYEESKNSVLQSVTTLKNYQIITTTAPGILYPLFLGYWIDTYPNHLYGLLVIAPIGGFVANLICCYNCIRFDLAPTTILYSYVLEGLLGGLTVPMTGCYTIITRTTPSHLRSLRFAVMEFFISLSPSIATVAGGKLLTLDPWIPNQYRNYVAVFGLTSFFWGLASIWALIFLRDAGKQSIERSPSDDLETNPGINRQAEMRLSIRSLERPNIRVNSTKSKKDGLLSILADIFNPKSVTTMMKTCCRKRDNYGRAQIWHLIAMMTVVLISMKGEDSIGYQFTQKVLNWSADEYSDRYAFLSLAPPFGTTLATLILVPTLKLSDTVFGIIGSLSLVISLTLKGALLTSLGYYLAFATCIFSGLASISIRSILSRIIAPNEVGQLYCILSCIEGAGPMISSIFHSAIFKPTLAILPGMAWHADAIIMLYPLAVYIWFDITRSRWDKTYKLKAKPRKQIEPSKPEVTPNGPNAKVAENSIELDEKSSQQVKY